MRSDNKQLINEAMALSIKGAALDCTHIAIASFHAQNSGTATTGVLKAQGSNVSVPGDTDWVDIASATVNITTAGNYGFTVADVGFKWVRPVYTQASGTGTLQVWSNIKGF